MDFLDLLRERLSGLLAERSGLDEQFEAILAAAAAEQRSNLNDAEEAEIAALRAGVEPPPKGEDPDCRDRVKEGIREARRASADAA